MLFNLRRPNILNKGMAGGNIVEVEVQRLAATPSARTPRSLNARLTDLASIMSAMGSEAPEPVRHEAAANAQIMDYTATAPPGIKHNMKTHCTGLNLYTNDGTTVYYLIPVASRTLPAGGDPVYKSENGVVAEQGRITDYGRMNGNFGWSADRDLIAGALASFTHNWVGFLGLYMDRPRLPQTQPWELPNLVLEETVAPEQFVLPATYKYQTVRPALKTKYIVELSSSTPITLGFDWWDAGKNDVARLDNIELEPGDNKIILNARVPMSGIFTINPIDAPSGLTVVSVNTVPRSI